MSARAAAKIERAMDVADRLAANDKAHWAEIIREVCRQNRAYRATCQQLSADNREIRARAEIARLKGGE